MREAETGGKNFEGGRPHHERDRDRDFGGGGGRDGRSGYREDNSHADRGRAGYGGRSQGINSAARGPVNSGGARDGQYGPGGGDRGNAYGPGSGSGRDRVDSQGPNRTYVGDRGGDRAGDRGSRRRSPSPVRRRSANFTFQTTSPYFSSHFEQLAVASNTTSHPRPQNIFGRRSLLTLDACFI